MNQTLARRGWRPATALFAACMLAGTAASQGIPYVPPELHQDVRRIQGDRITFCVWPETSPTASLDRAIAELVGEVLLVETVIVEHRPTSDLSPDEFLEDVYIQLGATCDALAGVVLATDNFPEWLVPTRPYLMAPYVGLVAAESPLERFGDVPANGIVGSQAYTEGDYALIAYLQSLPRDQRWRRFGYVSVDHMVGHLMAGSLQAVLAWQPAWARAEEFGAGTVRIVPMDPVVVPPSAVGFALRSDNTFLRSTIDVALEAIEADGRIAELAAESGIEHIR